MSKEPSEKKREGLLGRLDKMEQEEKKEHPFRKSKAEIERLYTIKDAAIKYRDRKPIEFAKMLPEDREKVLNLKPSSYVVLNISTGILDVVVPQFYAQVVAGVKDGEDYEGYKEVKNHRHIIFNTARARSKQ